MSTYPIDVSVNPTGAVDGSRRVKQELRGMDRLAKSLLKTFAGLFAGAAVAQGVRAGVRLLRDYEQEMSTLQAITGATEMQFASMRDTAKELGITTRFSAQEAAAGMTFLARAGFDARQATEAIGPTLLLAQAGGLGLASAADIASNVLKGFRLEVDQTNRVVDILAKASNSANTNVSQLGQALSFVAPVASGLGIELEQTVAAIGVLSDAGIQGSRAGTGLSRVLAELESPSENTRKIFAALGVDISAVKPSVVGLSGALEALTTAGIDTGTALEVFGQRGGPAFEVLASSIDDIQTLDEKLQNAGGSAERMAAIMDDNLNGAALAFRSAVQGLVIELGDAGLTDALKGLVAVLTEIVRFFADNAGTIVTALQLMAAATIAYHSANFIMTTFVKNQTIISMINLEKALGAATTRQALMGVASKSLARGLGLATGATKGLTVAMLANPIGAIAAGIAALVILFVKFGDRVTLGGDRLANLHDLAIATFQIIKESLSGLVSFFGDALTSMTRFFGDNFGFIGEFAQKVFGDVNLSVEGVLRFGAKAVDNFQGLWVGLFEAIKEVFSNFGPVIKGVFISALNGAVAIVEAGINKMVLAMNKLLGAVKAPLIPFADLGRIANENSDAVKNVGQAFLDGFNGVSLVEDQLDRILLRAEEIATKRISGQASGDPINVPSPANDNQGGPSRNAADLALAKERQAIIDQTVTSLDQEAAALRLLGDEREIYQRQLQIENEIADKLRNSDIDLTEEQIQKLSQLTDAEKTLITEKQRRNIALERQAAILDSIDAPLVNYQNAVTALNQLMAQGLITADAYNAAIAGTQLVQDLQGVDSALGGDFAQNAELERVRAQEAERLEIIRQAQEAGLLNQEQYEERYTAIVNNGARARMDIQLAEAERNASAVNDNQGGPSRNAADLALAKERQAIIDQTVTSLDQEAAALRLLGDEREIYQRQLQIENEIADKLRNSDIDLTEEQIQKLSQLTDAEKTLITEKQRRNIALERQAAILDSIDAPLVNYQNAVTALNQLMAQGLITADAYNAAIAGTQLVQDLQGVDSALGGDFAQNAELERVRAQEAERLEIIRQAQEAGLLNQEQYEERYTAIVNNGARARMDIQLAEAERNASAVKGGLDNILGAVETFAGKQNGLYKGILAARRAFATAEVIINTTRAVQSALAEYPFPINVGVAAGQAALGASNIAKINGVGFADGGIPMPGPGLLGGTGGPREDSNIIRVSRGEGILNAAAVRKNLGLFNALNEDPDFLKNIGLFRDGGVPISSTGQRASLNRRTISASDRDLISISFINNGAPQTYEVDFVSRDEIKIIANDIRKDVPGIVSGQIENPNSQISRSLKESTNAGRRV